MRPAIVKVLWTFVVVGFALQLSGCEDPFSIQSKVAVVITPASATEGDGTLSSLAAVSTSRSSRDDLVVTLASSDDTELTVPATVTVLAGETSAGFDLAVEDDAAFDGAQTVTVTASVSVVGWTCEDDSIDILDDEMFLAVSLPSNATEGDGTLSGAGAVTIPQALPDDLVVALASDDTTELTVPATATIAAGNTSQTFDLTVEDDVDIDGTQAVTVAASAAEWVSGSEAMDVLDND